MQTDNEQKTNENYRSAMELVELTPEEASTLAEYQKAIGDIQQQMQGVYRLISRQHQLEGSWELTEDGKSLMRRT